MRAMLAVLDRLPTSAAFAFARRAADAWFRFGATRRQVAMDNIRRAGIATDAPRARRIARASFRHFAVMAVESALSGRFLRADNWRDCVELDVAPETMRLFEDPNQGVILCSGHLGNWEIAAQILSFIKPVIGIASRMANPETDRIIQARRQGFQYEAAPKFAPEDPRRMLKVLKRGSALALLGDQNATPDGIWVPFFGRPACTHRSIPIVHMVSKAPMLFGYCVRTGPARFRMVAGPPIRAERTGDREADVRAILQEYHARLETAIRAYPEQYLWAHRRWRTPPPEVAAQYAAGGAGG